MVSHSRERKRAVKRKITGRTRKNVTQRHLTRTHWRLYFSLCDSTDGWDKTLKFAQLPLLPAKQRWSIALVFQSVGRSPAGLMDTAGISSPLANTIWIVCLLKYASPISPCDCYIFFHSRDGKWLMCQSRTRGTPTQSALAFSITSRSFSDIWKPWCCDEQRPTCIWLLMLDCQICYFANSDKICFDVPVKPETRHSIKINNKWHTYTINKQLNNYINK